MSTETIMQFLFNVLLAYIGIQAILHEKQLIRFERKAWRYIKAFFKALYYTIKERAGSTHFAEFKRMNVDDMSKTLCEQQLECKNCPVYDMCERGQNGFKVWLESDVKEKF